MGVKSLQLDFPLLQVSSALCFEGGKGFSPSKNFHFSYFLLRLTSDFLNVFGGQIQMSYFGTTSTPVLSSLGFKARVGSALFKL